MNGRVPISGLHGVRHPSRHSTSIAIRPNQLYASRPRPAPACRVIRSQGLRTDAGDHSSSFGCEEGCRCKGALPLSGHRRLTVHPLLRSALGLLPEGLRWKLAGRVDLGFARQRGNSGRYVAASLGSSLKKLVIARMIKGGPRVRCRRQFELVYGDGPASAWRSLHFQIFVAFLAAVTKTKQLN
jgi:hypothetical protein